MRVLFLTEWFDPLPAHKGLAFVKQLAESGDEIEVATTYPFGGDGRVMPGYAFRLKGREVMDGITVHRLPHFNSHDSSGIRRSLTFISFFFSALIFGLFKGRKYDVVYAYHPPITVGLAAALFCGLHRKPFVLDVLDLWPDGVAESGMARPSIVRVVKWMCNFAYRRAALVSVPTIGFFNTLRSRGVPAAKMALIYNFADEAKAQPSGSLDLTRYRLEGRFNIVYGGNFGRFQELDTVVAAARLAHARDPRIQLILVGAGQEESKIRELAAEAPDVVGVHPLLAMDQVGDLFAACDVLVAHLVDRPVFRVTVPQKVQFYLAMGKPIVGGLSGEGAQIVTDAEAGWVVPPSDAQAMAMAFLEAAETSPDRLAQMGANGHAFYMSRMSSIIARQRTVALFHNAAKKLRPYAAEAPSPAE